MGPLPFPSTQFLSDAGVKVAFLRKDYEAVSVLLLMACTSWDAEKDRGIFPDDPERIAAVIGLSADVVGRSVEFWILEGWIKREPGSVYIPFVTLSSAEQEVKGQVRSESARTAAVVKWDKAANRMLFASVEHTISTDSDAWPKEYTKWACDVWNVVFGEGSAEGTFIASEFGRLKRSGAKWSEVAESWERYVHGCDPKWARPGHWRPKWRNWTSSAPDIDERSREIAMSIDKQIRKGDFEPFGAIAKRGPR